MSPTNNSFVVTVKLVHVFGGIYIWEWVSTVPFEWEVFTGRRRFRWSFIAYELCRTMALASIITLIAGFNLTHQFNCEAWFRALLVFSYLGVAFSSLLILLRGFVSFLPPICSLPLTKCRVAIWGRSLTVLVFTASVWLCNAGTAIFSVMQGSVVWVPAFNTCLITNTTRFRWGMTVNFITDVTLLTVMFAGVLNKRNTTGLWRVLYIQGLSWILVAALSEILPATLSWINIDDGWNLMFQTPHMVTMVIMATRVYRNLFEYINPTYHPRLPPPQITNTMPSGQVQVTVHKTVDIDLGLHPSVSDADMTRGEREAKEMQFVV
ncbi:hypothetical protein EDB92DRAFT_2090765 [Lactarius akahatsu]|uniref:Uncharacterized protein n=1 Tax=Lactarius akahatsu TaxID=416441 RepID=A0AAD4LB52_9AGAM|nr:hypothetical protein EDB92DRAFT_2090765 [Lactarius akahatsu]